MNDKILFLFFFFFLISSFTARRDPLHTTVKKNIRAKEEECVGWEGFFLETKKEHQTKKKKKTSNQSVNR
jgi:hypothetical protein